MSSLPNGDSQVRLALLQERLQVLVESSKRWEERAEVWRNETTSALNRLASETSELKVAHRETREELHDVKTTVSDLQVQLKDKVGIEWFSGFWRIVIGVGAIIATVGGVLSILKGIRAIP